MQTRWFLLILVALTLAACDVLEDVQTQTSSEGQTSQTTQTQTEITDTSDTDTTDTADMAAQADTEPDAAAQTSAETTVAYNAPAWASLQLVNAHTGESFTLADFAGKTVMVEPMATWCSNCRAQQRNVRSAIEQLENPDDFVFISLSVENGLPDDVLAGYADQNGFNWLFTVGTNELVTALVNQFGRTVANPPATPHFTIAPDGTVSDLRTGRHTPQQLIDEVLGVSQT